MWEPQSPTIQHEMRIYTFVHSTAVPFCPCLALTKVLLLN